MVELFEKMGVPGTVISVIAFVLLVAGAIKEFTNSFSTFKKVFNWIKGIGERAKAKKEAREKMQQSLLEAQKIITDFSVHYSEDNISQRDQWMNWVNQKAEEYNSTLDNINKRLEKLDMITEETRLDQQRNAILDFAARVNSPQYDYSREHYRKIFKTIETYEKYIEDNNLTNGEVDAAVEKIEKAYDEKKNSGKLVW